MIALPCMAPKIVALETETNPLYAEYAVKKTKLYLGRPSTV